MRTSIDLESGVAVLDGAKTWITNAITADYLLVLARHQHARTFAALTWVLVPANHPGVSIQPADTASLAGAGLGHCQFDAVKLHADRVIGGVGRGMPIFTTHITMERWCSVWWALSVARRVLTTTHQYLESRDAGDGTMWSQQSVQLRFADCLLQYQLAHALADHGFADTRHRSASQAMLAKVASGRMLTSVLQECAQLQGADGFARAGIQSLRAEAAMFTLAGGATESLLLSAAADAHRLLSEPATA